MELKRYQKEDSQIICNWIKDEKSLYQWSADRIGKFPLADNALNENYASMMKNNRFIPLSAFDDDGNLVGHMFIRYPENDDSIVRFGFVIVAPDRRGYGNGKKMLQLAIDYAKNTLCASKITLGVFTNNDSARYCYESVGFRPVERTKIYKMPIGEWECVEMELIVSANGNLELLNNLDKLHTTELGVEWIKRNLSLDTDRVVEWCKDKICSAHAILTRRGKNWYVNVDGVVITVNAHSYTIITAHGEKREGTAAK